jgi:hypothetical protein
LLDEYLYTKKEKVEKKNQEIKNKIKMWSKKIIHVMAYERTMSEDLKFK